MIKTANSWLSRVRLVFPQGLRAKANRQQGNVVEIDDDHTPRCLARRRWAALIKRMWAIDPMICPRCQGPMKIVSFINPTQRDVIEKILRHCGLWPQPVRAPPRAPEVYAEPLRQLSYVSDLESVDAAPAERIWSAQ